MLGIGSTAKLVTPYLLLVLVLFELIRHRREVLRVAGASLAIVAGAGTAVYLALLGLFDRIAPPYDPQTGTTITGRPDRPHRAHVQLRRRADQPARARPGSPPTRGTG